MPKMSSLPTSSQRTNDNSATNTDVSIPKTSNTHVGLNQNNDSISFTFNNSLLLADGNRVRASVKLNQQTGESTVYKLVGTAIINNDINYVPWHFIWRISDFEFIAEEDKLEQRVRGPFQTEWLLQLYPHGHPSQRRKRFNKQDSDARGRHTDKFISTYARLTRSVPNRDSIAAKFSCDLLNTKSDATPAVLVSRLTQALYTKSTSAQYFRVNDNSSLAAAHINIPTCINSDKPDSQHYTIVFAMLVEYPQQTSIASYFFLPDKWPHQNYLQRRAKSQHFEQIQRAFAQQRDVNIVCSDGGVVKAHSFVLLQLNPQLAQRMWIKAPAQSPPPVQASTSPPLITNESPHALTSARSSTQHFAVTSRSSGAVADDREHQTMCEISEPDTPFASAFYCISALYNESQQVFCIDAEQSALQQRIASEDAAMNEGGGDSASAALLVSTNSRQSNASSTNANSSNVAGNSATVEKQPPPASTVLSDAETAEALCFATAYKIDWLAEDIANVMLRQLKPSNAVRFAHAASIANVQSLFNATVTIIAENYQFVTSDAEGGWLQLPNDWRTSMAKLVQEYAEANHLQLFETTNNGESSSSNHGRRKFRQVSGGTKLHQQHHGGQTEGVATSSSPPFSTRARGSANSQHSAMPSDNGSIDGSNGGGSSSSRGGRRRRKRNA